MCYFELASVWLLRYVGWLTASREEMTTTNLTESKLKEFGFEPTFANYVVLFIEILILALVLFMLFRILMWVLLRIWRWTWKQWSKSN